ncbi:hypothetical protein ACFX2J_014467 [Malus domestica]
MIGRDKKEEEPRCSSGGDVGGEGSVAVSVAKLSSFGGVLVVAGGGSKLGAVRMVFGRTMGVSDENNGVGVRLIRYVAVKIASPQKRLGPLSLRMILILVENWVSTRFTKLGHDYGSIQGYAFLRFRQYSMKLKPDAENWSLWMAMVEKQPSVAISAFLRPTSFINGVVHLFSQRSTVDYGLPPSIPHFQRREKVSPNELDLGLGSTVCTSLAARNVFSVSHSQTSSNISRVVPLLGSSTGEITNFSNKEEVIQEARQVPPPKEPDKALFCQKKGIQWDNDFNGWVNMSPASTFVMALNEDKVFDEIAKRWSKVTKVPFGTWDGTGRNTVG